ncbi:MAG: methylmalonyl-CoA mutase family protein [Alistipes sp.]
MANTKREKLFTEFPATSTEQWEAVITADLKGADYERKLVWKTGEGFNVRPYYRAENLAGIKFLDSQAGEFPYVRGTHAHNRWRVHQTITVECPKKANAEALEIMNAGVNSVGFCIASETFSAADLDTLLKGICLTSVEITFCGCKLADLAELVLAKIEKEDVAKEDVRICFCIDPLVKNLSQKGSFCSGNGEKCIEKIAALITKAKEYKHIRVVTVSGQVFGNAGSTIVEELAFTLAAGHDYLVRLMETGLSIDEAARKIRFSVGITSNYFMEIAKIRAARMLWANIVKAYAPAKDCTCKMFIHAVTSTWNQTVYDPYVNQLRGTTEAMSAALAGVHSLEVTPLNTPFEAPSEFSKRIARNVELLLKHEAHFDQVVDPAGGSYYIENLTQSIADQTWKLFREVEEKGGYTEAFKAGFIVEKVQASAAAKDKNMATRRQILLGSNQYPNPTEVAGDNITEQAVTRQSGDNVLVPYRGAMAFEAMRLHVDRSGKNPKAFMLTCGSLSMARARSQFSSNFFGCAGIKTLDNTFFNSVEEGAKAALESKAQIVVVCASDDDYAVVVPQVKALLAGKAILVVAGAPACAPELEAQGITNFINVKSNVLETLKFYLKEMGI